MEPLRFAMNWPRNQKTFKAKPMKPTYAVKLLILLLPSLILAQPSQDDLNIVITRKVSLEILGPNTSPYMQPLTETLNATANSRFFRTAEIPDTGFYVRVGVAGMMGFVRNDQKTYKPVAPVLSDTAFLSAIGKGDLVELNLINPSATKVKDTAGLVLSLIKYITWKGLRDPTSGFYFPEEAATVYGNKNEKFLIGKEYTKRQITAPVDSGGDALLNQVYRLLSPQLQQSILTSVDGLPNEIDLPRGGNVSTVFAGVPQFEIGSLYGTELLLRFIPPIRYDSVVGKFAFWGIGIKHSLSRYMKNPPVNIAAQFVYQGSSIENTIGATNAQLKTNTTIFGGNVHVSKTWNNWTIYSGMSYESINIDVNYKFLLPKQLQRSLGLIPQDSDEPRPPQYPGDQRPQLAQATLSDRAIKWVIGAGWKIGKFGIGIDYNVSKFNVLTLGMDYTL